MLESARSIPEFLLIARSPFIRAVPLRTKIGIDALLDQDGLNRRVTEDYPSGKEAICDSDKNLHFICDPSVRNDIKSQEVD